MKSNNRIRQRYFDELEHQCQLEIAKYTTYAQRKKAVNYFITFLNKQKIGLKQLNSAHIHNFVEFLTQIQSIRGEKLAAATIKQIYALSKSFYIRCYEKSIASKHPDLIFTKNLLNRYKLGQKKLPKYIDQEKMEELLKKCPDKWKALLNFMYETGARISEVLNLQKHHLNFKTRLVQIYEPKTMNIRVTGLSNKTIELMEGYISEYRPTPRPGHEDFVFINQQRRRMSIRAVRYIIKNLSSNILGSTNSISPHFFRAACAVHLLERGVDIRQVQEIIGWKSLSVVQNYTRVTPQRQIELKEQYHPGFQKEKINNLLSENTHETTLLSNQMKGIRLQMEKMEQRYQQELQEMKITLHREKQAYETRIDELVKSQQQLIQLLTQKST